MKEDNGIERFVVLEDKLNKILKGYSVAGGEEGLFSQMKEQGGNERLGKRRHFRMNGGGQDRVIDKRLEGSHRLSMTMVARGDGRWRRGASRLRSSDSGTR
jgi:hypothetical protein